MAEPAVPERELDPAIRAMLERPVNEVLAALGLPPVPLQPPVPVQQQLPPAPKGVPEAPQVPGFDVAGLVKPMTDLLSTFGSGSFGGLDPSAAFSGASQALEQGMSTGMSALGQLSSVWQGPAAMAATGKGTEAAAGTGMVAEQGAELSTAVGEAAAVVGAGEAELQAIIDSFMAVISALGPSLWLPPGQAAAVAAAEEHLTHATAVVTRVKGQLSGLSGQVGAAGRKVPVASPPMSAAMTAAQVASSVIPAVVSAATGAVTSAGKMATDTVSGAAKAAVGIATSAGEAMSQAAEAKVEASDSDAASDPTASGGELRFSEPGSVRRSQRAVGCRWGLEPRWPDWAASAASVVSLRPPVVSDNWDLPLHPHGTPWWREVLGRFRPPRSARGDRWDR